MTRRQHTVILGALLLGACKPSSEHTEPATTTTTIGSHPQPDTSPHAIPPAPQPCKLAVPDAAAAVELAEQAKRAAGFPDIHRVDGPKTLTAEGFYLSPMVPLQWPSSQCSVIFYISEIHFFLADSPHIWCESVGAQITLQLDTGKYSLSGIEHAPSLGGSLIHGGGSPLAADLQQWVFEAVATSTVPVPSKEIEHYKKWLKAEEQVASTLLVWHRAFFDFVVSDDPDIMRVVKGQVQGREDVPPPWAG